MKSSKLQEGTYIFEDGKYKCAKCSYWSNYPCLLISHLKRKTPCEMKDDDKKTFIFKKGDFKIIFS